MGPDEFRLITEYIQKYYLMAFDILKKFAPGTGQAFGLRDEGKSGFVVLGEEHLGEEIQPIRGILRVGLAVLFYLHAESCMVN